MKKLIAIVVAVVLLLAMATPVLATNLYEYYNTGDRSSVGFSSAGWIAQTFTAQSNHSVTSVRLKLYRRGSPGTITVSIRATDGSGHPTGSDLTSGTTDGNTLTTSFYGEWRKIALTSYDLSSGTQYAIVVRAPDVGYPHRGNWRLDASYPTYGGGNYEVSSDGGNFWTGFTNIDLMFEVWGLPPADMVVDIDIKPGSDPNSINPKSKGVIPVAILGSATFDVTTVDVTTLNFEGASPAHDLTNPSGYVKHLEDVNGDGYTDLVSHYRTQQTIISSGDTQAWLTGNLTDGTSFQGCDSVRTVGK